MRRRSRESAAAACTIPARAAREPPARAATLTPCRACPQSASRGSARSSASRTSRSHTLKERALHPFRRAGADRLHALDDVSFAVAEGEFFGIVGRNGSGKSTLLKCLAGIYQVDRGQIRMRGRLSTFIELGVGFNPDLPARDNVLINGIMLGLSPKEALRRFDAIIAFAELEEFVDLKLKNYSSGMQVRLAFSVMSQVDADVLLIDEVLAVGDAAFQQKCFDVFQRMKDEGKTILFVTHDMAAVNRFCDRAVLLERGRVELIGAARPRRRALPRSATSTATARGRRRRRGGARRRRHGGDRRGLVRGRRRARRRAAAGRRVHRLTSASARTRRWPSPRSPSCSRTTATTRCGRSPTRTATRRRARTRPGDEAVFSVTFRNVFAPGRVHAHAVDGARGRRADHRPPPAPGLRGGDRRAPLGRPRRPAVRDALRARRAGAGVSARARPADRRARPRSAAARGASSTSR